MTAMMEGSVCAVRIGYMMTIIILSLTVWKTIVYKYIKVPF